MIAQLRQADLVVLNKLDLVTPDRLADTRALIARHSPHASILMTEHARLPMAVLFGARPADRADEDPAGAEVEAHHAADYAAALIEREPMSRGEFEYFARELSGSAVRSKGYVALSDAPEVRHLYQQVGRRWTLIAAGDWGAMDRRTRLITITVRGAADHHHHHEQNSITV